MRTLLTRLVVALERIADSLGKKRPDAEIKQADIDELITFDPEEEFFRELEEEARGKDVDEKSN